MDILRGFPAIAEMQVTAQGPAVHWISDGHGKSIVLSQTRFHSNRISSPIRGMTVYRVLCPRDCAKSGVIGMPKENVHKADPECIAARRARHFDVSTAIARGPLVTGPQAVIGAALSIHGIGISGSALE